MTKPKTSSIKQTASSRNSGGFAEAVYAALRAVPRGRVTTYAALAAAVGAPRAMRAVGNALHVNPYAPAVPCHRVVRSDGALGGFADGSQAKKKLLVGEGVCVKNNRIDLGRFGVSAAEIKSLIKARGQSRRRSGT